MHILIAYHHPLPIPARMIHPNALCLYCRTQNAFSIRFHPKHPWSPPAARLQVGVKLNFPMRSYALIRGKARCGLPGPGYAWLIYTKFNRFAPTHLVSWGARGRSWEWKRLKLESAKSIRARESVHLNANRFFSFKTVTTHQQDWMISFCGFGRIGISFDFDLTEKKPNKNLF